MEEQQKDFAEFLRERLKQHNLSLKRLSELSGVSAPHIENMLRDDWEELPAAPYLRGYLKHLGEVLDFDPEVWWIRLRQTGEVSSSGARDELPRNRFALRAGRKYGWLIAAGALVLLYLGLRFAKIFGQPILIIQSPAETVVRVTTSSLTVSGETRDSDQLLINSEAITFSADGTFQKNMLLQPGLNTIEVTAKKFLGGETKILRQVIYEPQNPSSTAPAGNSPTATSTPIP